MFVKEGFLFSLSRRDYEVVHEEKLKENTMRSCTRSEGEETEIIFRSSGQPTDPTTPVPQSPPGLVRMPNMIFMVNPDLADIVFFSTDSDAQDTLET